MGSSANDAGAVIDFWSDIECTWASLSVHRLRAARTRLELVDRVVLRHRAFPLELINIEGTPKKVLDDEREVLIALEPDLGWQHWRREDWL